MTDTWHDLTEMSLPLHIVAEESRSFGNETELVSHLQKINSTCKLFSSRGAVAFVPVRALGYTIMHRKDHSLLAAMCI